MKFHTIILFFAILNCGISAARAQDTTAALYPLRTAVVFPPLSVLIDSAIATNPTIRFRDQGVIGKQCNLKTYQNYWTRNLGIQADVRYGTFDNFSTSTSDGQSPSSLASRNSQTNYGVGAYLKLPIQDVVNRKNLIIMAKSELDQAESMAEAQRNEIRQLVIRQYNEVLLKQNLLKIKSKSFGIARVNNEMVEKEFQNGIISITEYARVSDIVAQSESNYETAKAEYITAYMLLEEIVGFKFVTATATIQNQ